MMESEESMQKSIPDDIALKIVSYLEVSDVCALSCCSRFWRRVCGSDYIWSSLCIKRWRYYDTDFIKRADLSRFKWTTRIELFLGHQHVLIEIQGWKGFYLRKHRQIGRRATKLVDFVNNCSASSETINMVDYLEATSALFTMQFGFKDVQFFLLKPHHNKLIYALAVSYCVSLLLVWDERLIKVLEKHNISLEQQIEVRWSCDGFRRRGTPRSSKYTLRDLVQNIEILRLALCRDVHNIQISVVPPKPQSAFRSLLLLVRRKARLWYLGKEHNGD